MKHFFTIVFALLFFIGTSLATPKGDTTKAWTWWWWFGNSSTNSDITKQLEYMKKSGIGGVCLIPLYGEKGDEANYVDLLSPKFMATLEFISKECERLGLGLDMTMGSGWPFGGSWIDEAHSSKKMDEHMRPSSTKFKVKRSSPGGHGYALDPFSPEANNIHFAKFNDAFGKYAKAPIIRGFFNDSYEYSMANYTDNFYAEFQKRRGYDFTQYAPLIYAPNSEAAKSIASTNNLESEDIERIWQDYHNTLSDLLYDVSATTFTKSANKLGTLSVYQAHGSPANLIDLYALSDIPQTESFGSSKFNISGVRNDPDYQENRFGRPERLMMKFATSAANLTNKKLVSSESCTWLTNHFKTSLSQVKPELDKLFAAGINHIFYHGTPYSPIEKKFPARLFYASTNFNYNSHFKEYFPELNAYVEIIQRHLQNSENDNDVLVYFPIHAFWKESGGKNKILLFDVHKSSTWLARAPDFDELIHTLDSLGFSFDYISDAFLKELTVRDGNLYTRSGARYKTLVIPYTKTIPIETFRTIDALIKAGAKIVFQNKIPDDITGFHQLVTKRGEVYDITSSWIPYPDNVRAGKWVPSLLTEFDVKRETLSDHKLNFIRKNSPLGKLYFIANLDNTFKSGELELNAKCIQLEHINPLTGERSSIPFSRTKDNTIKFNLNLYSGESCILIARDKDFDSSLSAKPFYLSETPFELTGEWTINFIRNLPEGDTKNLPSPLKTKTLKSWTELGDASHKKFCGVAKYALEFTLEEIEKNSPYELNFSDIRDACKVKVNGKNIASIWSAPFKAIIPTNLLKEGKNTLEVEVTNNSFNRIREMSARDKNWAAGNFIVDITYTPPKFDTKPLEPSGLIGKVTIKRLYTNQE